MSDDLVEGFRVSDKIRKKVKKEIFRSGKTKKEWLENRVDQLENLHKVKNKPDEKWTMIPSSELEHLHSGYPDHYEFIHQRILEHCLQQDLEITFENLLLDCLYFYNYNDMKYVRYTDEDLEVLVIEHSVGISYSEFTIKLLTKFLNVTDDYKFISSQSHENKIIIKFKSNQLS